MTVTVRSLEPRDRAAWQELYAGYGDFYETPLSDEKAELVFGWLLEPAQESFCLVAVNESDRPIALAHYREFSRPLAGGRGLYLDDLFTSAEARGSGAASALITALKDIATVKVTMTVQADPTGRADPVQIQNRVGLPNLVSSRLGLEG